MCLVAVGVLTALAVPALLPQLLPRGLDGPRLALGVWLLGSLSVVASWMLVGVVLPGTMATVLVVGGVGGRLAFSLARIGWRERATRLSHAQAARILGGPIRCSARRWSTATCPRCTAWPGGPPPSW
jgi:hypothetical protein